MSPRKISVDERDAWRIYELLEVMNDFLHQEEKYRQPGAVASWLRSGVNDELRYSLYKVAAKWFPPDPYTDKVEPPIGVKRRFPTT